MRDGNYRSCQREKEGGEDVEIHEIYFCVRRKGIPSCEREEGRGRKSLHDGNSFPACVVKREREHDLFLPLCVHMHAGRGRRD